MSSCWPWGRSRIGRLALLTIASLVPCLLMGGPYADLDARLQGRPDVEAVRPLQRLAPDDADAQAAIDDGPRAARAYVGLRASLEGAEPPRMPPIGKVPGEDRIASSWLGRALDRLHSPKFDSPALRTPSGAGVGSWATSLMWAILVGLGLVAAYLLVRYVRLPRFKRRTRALIAVDEPVQTADAWLEEANALIAEGRYREAMRGLYVAGLLRLDEAGVARFDRNQTNWEHLRRIEASSKKPEGIEVRDATERFDRAWYGHRASTVEDATTMRAWYDALVRRLAEAKAA